MLKPISPASDVRTGAFGLLLGALHEFRVAFQHLDEIVDAAGNAAREIARPEARQDGVLDDEAGDGIGQRAFEPVADLDPHRLFVRRHDEQRAVVPALLADAPMAAEPVAEILDLQPLQRWQRDDDELRRGLGFEIGQFAVDLGLGRDVDDLGVVDDAARQRRKCGFGGVGQRPGSGEPPRTQASW